MRLPFRLAYTACAIAAGVAGCAGDEAFPSLAPRPGERDRWAEEPMRPPVEVADDAALRERVAALLDDAAEGDRVFAAALPAAEAAIAAAGQRESESWIAAQQALSRLEAARVGTTRALAELDGLAVGRAEVPTSAADFATIGEAITTVERIAAGQQTRLDALRTRLSGR